MLDELVSASTTLGDDVGLGISLGDGIEMFDGGGSMAECVIGALDGTAGSGKAGMASSADEVSMVICVVALIVVRCV